jgi:hypothetical protein
MTNAQTELIKTTCNVKHRLCLTGLAIMVMASPVGADENKQRINCDSGWRSITKNVMSGEGQASISAQCRSNEKPCPPRHELVRRARLVANAYALANIQAKVRSEVSHEVVVESGVGSDRLTIKAGGEVFQMKFCGSVSDNDKVYSRAYGEIE